MHLDARNYTRLVLPLIWVAGLAYAESVPSSKGCLNAVYEGEKATPVIPCGDGDPLNFSSDPDIKKAMLSLGINSAIVKFRGCRNSRYFADETTQANNGTRQYIVNYPAEMTKGFLAPVTHELAHVLQMDAAGGKEALRKDLPASKRVELGADFLTGVVFSQALTNIDINQFQHNLSLMGSYVELDKDAHGTPAERVSAFRRGIYLPFDRFNRDIRRVNDNFQGDIYGQVIQIK